MKWEAHAPSLALPSSPNQVPTPHKRDSTCSLDLRPTLCPHHPEYLAYRGPRVAPLASGQASGEEHLLGVSWLGLPPSPHCPQPPPSVLGAPRSCGPNPEKRCVSPWQPITMQQDLPGYGLGCADVSAQGSSKARPLAPGLAEQTGAGAALGPAGRIAPPLAGKGCQKQAAEAGVRDTDLLHVKAAPPSPYQHQGPSTSGKSWLSTEEGREDRLQPRRVRADPKEDRERPRGSSIHSTAQAGSEATEGWGKGCSHGLPLLPKSPFLS